MKPDSVERGQMWRFTGPHAAGGMARQLLVLGPKASYVDPVVWVIAWDDKFSVRVIGWRVNALLTNVSWEFVP